MPPPNPDPSRMPGEPDTQLEGHPLPFENKGELPGLFRRITATVHLFWTDAALAGEGLGMSPSLRPAIYFYAMLGLPVVITAGFLQIFFPLQPWFMALLGGPKPMPQEGLALVGNIVGVLLAPLFLAVAFALTGVLNHVGLWMVGGTGANLGLPVTFRTLLYGAGALVVPISLAELALDRLPGSFGTFGQVVALGAQVGIFFYQGVIFARAHRTETWRGVLGMLMPILIIGLVCGGTMGLLWVAGGDAFREGLLKALQGGA